MENEPGQSGFRKCHVCGKFSSQSDFKENSCRQCWKWFWFNCDEYFHKESKNVCPYNCETVSCNSCRLKKFLEFTQYRCGQRQCTSCGCKTVINGKNPKCSCCRLLATKKCTCNITAIPCPWCVKKTLNTRNNNVDVESSVANEKPSSESELQSTSAVLSKPTAVSSMPEFRTKSPAIDVIKDCETSHATIHIDLSLLPKNLQAKAKKQVLGNCYVRICDLSSAIIKSSRKETEERKAKKRPRNDSWTINEDSVATAKIPNQVNHGKSHKQKAGKERDSLDYNVMNVSDTRLILRLGTEHHDTDVESPHITNKEKSHFPRKNYSVKTKFPLVHRNIVPCQGSKSESKMKDDAVWRATVDKASQTEPSREIECLQRRINELELIIASSRSCHTPSPLGAALPLKIPDDPTLTLSTPPSSDSGFSTKNQTPTKSPCVLVNRLTKDVLEHYGIRRNSSVSPTADESRPKKRPRLNSLDSDHRSFKKSDKKNGGTRKVLELFGNESEEDALAPKDMLVTGNVQPFDLDGLDYDENENEDSRPSTCYSAESQQTNKPEKTNKTDHHDKSSKAEKNEKKDKRKVKERKKKEDQISKTNDTLKSLKVLKERGDKEVPKPRKDQTTVGNSSKFRIPKLAASTTIGLPSLLQENLDQASKATTSLSVGEPQLSRTPEPEPAKNLVTKSRELLKVSSTIDNIIELPASTSSIQPSGKVAHPILCILPKTRNKSVNFPEQLETIRSISPRSQLQGPEQEDLSVREKYIPIILEDLDYVPESSPRVPVKGLRPFHPPARKIDREKLKSLAQKRGGGRFIYSSSSSSSSENESSETESDQENKSNSSFEKSPSQTRSFTATVSTVESHSVANDSSDLQQNGRDVCMSYIVQKSVEKTSLSSTENMASETLTTTVKCISRVTTRAVTDDSTKDISSVSISEEHVQAISPKKTRLPSLAVSPSPRRCSPEPSPQTSSFQDRLNEMKNLEEDESEDDDVLDIGLNDEEIFDYGFDEADQLQEPPPPKLPAARISNGSAGPVSQKGSQPSPPKTVTTSIRTNVPAVPVKPPVILRSTVPTVPRDDQTNNRGLCHEFIRTGECTVSDQPNKKCVFSHNIDFALEHIQFMCNKKGSSIQLASRLVYSMSHAESPLNKSLREPVGLRMVETVIRAIMMERRPDQVVFALWMMNNHQLPMAIEFIDAIIHHTPQSPANAKLLVSLYERCQQDRIKLSVDSYHIIINILINDNLKGWDFICNVVERAMIEHARSYNPTHEVLGFLFDMALDRQKLEGLCHLFHEIGHPVLVALGQEKRREVLNRLRDFGLVDWYDRYSGILRRPVGNEMHSQFVAPQHPPNGMIHHLSHNPAISLHRTQHSLPQTNPLQPPFRPQLYDTRPPMPTLPPPGSYRPSIPWVPSAALQRPPPPIIPLASLHRPQPPPIVICHSVVSAPRPPAPGAYVTNVTKMNGPALLPSESDAPLTPVPDVEVDSSDEIVESPPIIPLQVPKPSHSLALDLFEPESPEVEPTFVDSEPEQGPGPSVVVQPSYETEDALLTEYKEMKFVNVTGLFLQYYSGNRRCPMLASLMQIMKTNPLYGPEGNQELSPGDIFIQIISCACEKGSAITLEPRHLQALLDLLFFILLHFLQTYNISDEDEQITQLQVAKDFLKMVPLFELPLNDFIKHPELLLFVAECFLQIDLSKEEEEDFMEGVADDICSSITFLTEFHKVVTETSSNSLSSTLVEKEFMLSGKLKVLCQNFKEHPDFQPYLYGILGVMEDFQNASLKNRTRLDAFMASQE